MTSSLDKIAVPAPRRPAKYKLKRRRLPPRDLERRDELIADMRATGASLGEIARGFGLHKETIRRILASKADT